jgi:ubiquinone/menaquinone biosynthesis C-methylase UbiE
MNQQIDIKTEARRYFTKHYPLASRKEIDKQVEDWQNKVTFSRSLVSFFEERVGKVNGKKILDVGFGSGGIATAFHRVGAEVYGVDIDPELKEIAQRNVQANNAKAQLEIYDGVNLPFQDSYFDYIVSSSVLEHVSKPEELLKDIFRVMKPGSRFLLTLPNKYYPKETHTLAYFVSYMPRRLADIYLKILKRSPLAYDNLHFYSYFDVLKMLKRAGYEFELVYKDLASVSSLKKFLISVLKKFNIHYTAFLRQLIFIIEKK